MMSGNSAKLMQFPKDSVILREGEMNLDMYKIVQGYAEMYMGYGTDQEVLLGIIGPQTCFGEFGLLLKKPAIYTVVAYSNILAMRVTEGDVGDFVQENHKSIIDIMRNMAKSMMVMQKQIDMLSNEINEGKEDERRRQNLRAYALNNSDKEDRLTGKYHFINNRE